MFLTDARARNAKPGKAPYKLTDSAGLHLEVRSSGAKLWHYRYRIAGKEKLYALGEYAQARRGQSGEEAKQHIAAGHLTLTEARAERDKARALVKQGMHWAHNRWALRVTQAAENANTFEAVAKQWIAKRKAKWTPYYLPKIERFLNANVYPHIGTLPIRAVTPAHLLEIVRRVEKRAPSVALLIRQ